MNDIFVGRFVKYEEDRKDSSGNNIGDYRYMIDFAGKFFYLVDPLTSAHNRSIVPTSLPNTNTARGIEPEAKFAEGSETVLTEAIDRIRTALQVIHDRTPKSVSSTSGTTPGTIPSPWAGSHIVQTENGNVNKSFTWGTEDQFTTTSVYTSQPSTVSNVTIYAKSGTGSYVAGDIIYTHTFTWSTYNSDEKVKISMESYFWI